MIYRIGTNGLESASVTQNDAKNNLPIGTMFQLNGYDNPRFVMVKNLGISERFASSGAKYELVKLEDHTLRFTDAFTIKHISEKADNRIQMYYTDEIMPIEKVQVIDAEARAKEQRQKQAQQKAVDISNAKEQKGRKLFAKHIPPNAQSLIVAELEHDNCDLMTDYFATSTSKVIILGWSKHKRDLFSEMRKHAHKIPETAHLSTKPTVDSNGRPKTEENKSWWTPADEHREKYSMGHGYYLKAETRYSTGWRICKRGKYGNDWDRELYISMAERCVF